MPLAGSTPLLQSHSASPAVEGRERAIADLLAQARTVIDGEIVDAGRRCEILASDAADLANEAVLRLVGRMERLIEDGRTEPIARFNDYVRATVHNLIEDHRAGQSPLRSRLAARLHYVVTHTAELALWSREPALCGLVALDRHREAVPVAPLPPLSQTRADDARELRQVVVDLLRRSGGPVELPELLSAVAQAAGLAPRPFVPVRLSSAPSETDLQAGLESRQYLEAFWSEIVELPLRQRKALLLGRGFENDEAVAVVLAGLGVAGPRRIAVTLEMPLAELLAQWNELPLPDSRLASSLGLTRQQVINLRKSARDRLARRLGRPRAARSPS
jgi:DNA-directed RNA polymerase specialized sigma24 family protein